MILYNNCFLLETRFTWKCLKTAEESCLAQRVAVSRHVVRLMALESELAELRLAVRELSQTATCRALQPTSSNQDATTSVPVISEVSLERTEDQRVATCLDPPVAPVRVIRKMYTWINGNPEAPKDVVELSEPIKAQLASNGLGLRLIETSRKNISRLHFIQGTIDKTLSEEYNLLSVTCMLAGMQTNFSIISKDLHMSLYGILKSGLEKLALESPLSLPSLYAMLLTCLLNLNLGYSDSFIDAWLLSGSLILHLMLSLDFPFQQQTPLSLRYPEDDRNRILTWNAACLQHLNTNKLSAVRMDLAAHYINVVKHADGFNELDKEIVAELELFILLYRGIVEEHISAEQLQSNLSQWHTANTKLLNLDESLELKFAISTFSLLTHRWELSRLRQADIENARENAMYDQHIEPILKYSHQIIRISREMTGQKRVIHTFDFLMGAYAHVTLVEFADHLEDIDKTFRLMEEVQNLRKDTYVVEPVSIWAMNMMRKRLLDTVRPEMDVQTEMLPGLDVWWPPFEALSTRMEYTSTEVSERDQ
ncbi:Transcriptional activator of proteases prtT [Fusarium oxysporum f. sp. cubense race 1]|uniref:Transcriptional activator of proteases prtT n=1 Tax=Fusarium oxysporum f. sp. cubense (strain race 1) TaxID=1229664 RepID=N4UF06_FUSC1|nr:Transcriptional activator of proteases prtT [Fusarium oxysporum f. sp. cubense race 1]